MHNEIAEVIISMIILGSCVYALYRSLAPIVEMKEEDAHDDIEH